MGNEQQPENPIVLLLSNTGKVLECNANAVSLLSLHENDIVGRKFNAIFGNAPSIPAIARQISNTSFIGTYHAHHHKLPLIISWNVSPLSGDSQYIVMIGRVVTTNMIAADRSDDNSYFKQVINNIPSFLFWKNKESVFLGCNENFARSAGLSESEEIVGKTDYDLPWAEQASLYISDDKAIMASGKAKLNIEEPQTTAEGKYIVLLTSKVPLKNTRGDICGIIGIYNDITDLRTAQQKAEAASKAKTEFIANMSHDLRTPITGMLGLVQDMINVAEESTSSLTEEQSSHNSPVLEHIISTVQRDGHYLMVATDELLQLCNEILDVARLESGKLDDSVVSFSVAEIVTHAIELFQPVAQHKRVALSYHIGHAVPPYLQGLRIYLARILLNLVSNALKFTEKGSVKVIVSIVADTDLDQHQEASVTLRIVVADTGIGIPEDKFETIFGHFSRLTSSYDGIYKGAGLGLYTVKRYVKAMKGTVRVESQLGEGSQFIVTLPFIIVDELVDDGHVAIQPIRAVTQFNSTPKPKPMVDTQSQSKKKGGIILIVEDHELAAMAVQVILKPFHCATEIARSGEQAVAMAARGDYDLILMDIGLPDFNGVEATKKIRALPDPKKAVVPIIALTGHADDVEKHHEALAAGMQDILTKPAQPLALEPILQRYVVNTASKEQAANVISPESSSDALVAIDWEASVRLCNGDPDFLQKLLSMLAADVEKAVITLATHYNHHDIDALRDELHRLRGGVSYVKVPQLEHALLVFHDAIIAIPYDRDQVDRLYTALMQAIHTFQKTWKAQKLDGSMR